MDERGIPELLAAAQSRVNSARKLLTCPHTCNIDDCTKYLLEAQGYLEGLRDNLAADAPGAREWREPLIVLGREIRMTKALLDQAARFGRRWLERLRASGASYTAAGSPAILSARRSISVLG